MDLDTFIVAVFCEVEDWLESQRPPRQRGPKPKLSDSEVLTTEAVGEFLGIDTDQGLYTFFWRNYAEWFPTLPKVHRTTFTRQVANLWALKDRLWRHLLGRIRFDSALFGGQLPRTRVSLREGPPLPAFGRRIRFRSR